MAQLRLTMRAAPRALTPQRTVALWWMMARASVQRSAERRLHWTATRRRMRVAPDYLWQVL
jgi:hypothetical protein